MAGPKDPPPDTDEEDQLDDQGDQEDPEATDPDEGAGDEPDEPVEDAVSVPPGVPPDRFARLLARERGGGDTAEDPDRALTEPTAQPPPAAAATATAPAARIQVPPVTIPTPTQPAAAPRIQVPPITIPAPPPAPAPPAPAATPTSAPSTNGHVTPPAGVPAPQLTVPGAGSDALPTASRIHVPSVAPATGAYRRQAVAAPRAVQRVNMIRVASMVRDARKPQP